MSTPTKKLVRIWLLTGVVAIGAGSLLATTAVAEEDHLVGYKIKDDAGIQPPGTYDLTNAQQGGSLVGGSCELKKAKFLLVQGEKNGGDDPRGGPAGKFMCYRAKCAGLTTWDGDDQFGSHLPVPKKAQLVCAPFVDTNSARFLDNGDGTVTDTVTRLIWEKKDNAGSIHDKDNTYTWSTGTNKPDGTAFATFLYALNGGTSPDGVATTGCFTGHCDWRLPTIEELHGIADPTQGVCAGGSGACIDPIFGLTNTSAFLVYFSRSTLASNAGGAWGDLFTLVPPATVPKAGANYVRAVRDGS